jgi:hypothetical protein
MEAVKIHKLGPRDVIVVDEVPGSTRTGSEAFSVPHVEDSCRGTLAEAAKPRDIRYDV